MSNRSKGRIIFFFGILVCIVPSVLAVNSYFSIWKKLNPSVLASGTLMSAFSLALIACVAIPPLARYAEHKLSGKSPSAWLGFTIAAVILFCVQAVIDALVVIFLVAATSNFIGAIIFKVADHIKEKPDIDDDEENICG